MIEGELKVPWTDCIPLYMVKYYSLAYALLHVVTCVIADSSCGVIRIVVVFWREISVSIRT
jgi:hypothetical protein